VWGTVVVLLVVWRTSVEIQATVGVSVPVSAGHQVRLLVFRKLYRAPDAFYSVTG